MTLRVGLVAAKVLFMMAFGGCVMFLVDVFMGLIRARYYPVEPTLFQARLNVVACTAALFGSYTTWWVWELKRYRGVPVNWAVRFCCLIHYAGLPEYASLVGVAATEGLIIGLVCPIFG